VGKRRKKVKPESRAKARGAAGRAPLLVLAGLPSETARAAAGTINNDAAITWRAISVPFPDHDPIYDIASVEDLASQVLNYAKEDEPPNVALIDPTRIVLAYVDSDWTDPLWEVFGSSVWPVRMSCEDWGWEGGRHWRFDIDTVMAMVRRAVATAESAHVTALRLRLEAHRRDDPLLLPARNFLLPQKTPLKERFLDLLDDEFAPEAVEALDADVVRRKFPFPNLRKFYSLTGGENLTFAVDSRDLVFAKARVGQDGAQHLITDGADLTTERLRRELEGRFRFGTPLIPAGFQHDVQWEFGAPLVRERMFHVDLEDVDVFGDHANVFANDMITADRVEKT
jgi:hypothetical protein